MISNILKEMGSEEFISYPNITVDYITSVERAYLDSAMTGISDEEDLANYNGCNDSDNEKYNEQDDTEEEDFWGGEFSEESEDGYIVEDEEFYDSLVLNKTFEENNVIENDINCNKISYSTVEEVMSGEVDTSVIVGRNNLGTIRFSIQIYNRLNKYFKRKWTLNISPDESYVMDRDFISSYILLIKDEDLEEIDYE